MKIRNEDIVKTILRPVCPEVYEYSLALYHFVGILHVHLGLHGSYRVKQETFRPVKFLGKKIVTMRAMTTFSERGARAARTRRKTESGNTSILLTSLGKWSAKLIGTLCSARIIINVSAIVIP